MILMKYFHGSLAVLYPLSLSLFKTENFESLNFFAYLRLIMIFLIYGLIYINEVFI